MTFKDAVTLHVAVNKVMTAVGHLAAKPLDEEAAAEMREALDHASEPEVREALETLRDDQPGLSVVQDGSQMKEPA